MAKSVLVVSWVESLAQTRKMLLSSAGYAVISALGRTDAMARCRIKFDLLVLGHSVPRSEKRRVIACYREYSTGPVLSLLRANQMKLPEADFGVEVTDPGAVVRVIRNIL